MEPSNARDGQPLFESVRGTTTITLVCLVAGGYRILSNGTEVGSWEAARLPACMRTYMDLLDMPAPAGRMPANARGRTVRQGSKRSIRGAIRTDRKGGPVETSPPVGPCTAKR
jgi:hypothetical protein